jgi:hypothetical protein
MARRNPPARWVLPDEVNPPDSVCFKIHVPNNKYHIAAFKGALYMLSSAIFWADDPAHTALRVAKVWQEIFDSLVAEDCNPAAAGQDIFSEDFMSDFRRVCIDGKTYLEFLACSCPETWVRLANADQLAAAGQPGGSGTPQPQPQPGSDPVCYDLAWPTSGLGNIPTLVSTGDVLTLNSASGAGATNPTADWRCIDGLVFFAGACTGTTTLDSLAPAPTLPKGELLWWINGVYYSAQIGVPFTVPGGVSSVTPFLVANFQSPNQVGSYKANVCVKNNAPVTWCHHLDFRVSSYGFVSATTGGGGPDLWSPGVGWHHPGGVGNELRIKFTAISAFTVTRWQWQMNDDAGSPASDSSSAVQMPNGTNVPGTFQVPLLSGTNTGDVTHTTTSTNFSLTAEDAFAANLTWIESNVFGTGFDPFAGAPLC